jgi:hypothetical protein
VKSKSRVDSCLRWRSSVLIGVLTFLAPQARADFIGQDVDFAYGGNVLFTTVVPDSGFQWDGAGTSNVYLGLSVDLTGSNLTLSESPGYLSTGWDGNLTLTDLSNSGLIISDVVADSATDVSGFQGPYPYRVSFTNDEVNLDMTGITIYSGQEISLDFQFNVPAVPEPRMIGFLLCSSLLLICQARRHNRDHGQGPGGLAERDAVEQ